MPAIHWLGLVQLLAIGLALAWSVTVWVTLRKLGRPPRRGYGTQVARGLAGEPSELEEPLAWREWRVGDCPVWEIDCENPAGPVVIFTHGWGHARQDVLERIGAVRGVARAVLAWDAPGHGEHPAKRSELGTSEHAVLGEIVERAREIGGGSRVVLWGWSMGAGISIACAGGVEAAGVIAESPFRRLSTPARNMLRAARLPHRFTLGPVLWLAGLTRACGASWRGFDRAYLARGVRCPLLVLHGTEDEVSPIEDGAAIAGAAPAGELTEIEGGRHRDLWEEPWRAQSETCVRGFVERVS